MACPSLSLWSRNVWRKRTSDLISSGNMPVPLDLSAISTGLFVCPSPIVQRSGCLFRNLERLKVGFILRSSEYILSFLHLFGLSSSVDIFTISSFPRELTIPFSHLGHWMGKSNPLRSVKPIIPFFFFDIHHSRFSLLHTTNF